MDDFDCFLIDIIGLTEYKLPSFVQLIYDMLVDNISANEGYESEFLRLPIEKDSDFLVRGLILDYINGNVLRLRSGGFIAAASHGSIPLSEEDIDTIYPGRRWQVADQFFGNDLIMLKGHVENKLMVLLTHLEIAVGLAFIRMVDTVDVITHFSVTNYLFAYDAITSALKMVLDENNGYLAKLIAAPERYLHQCPEKTIQWLISLKQSGKHLILLSEWSFSTNKEVLKYILGPHWNSLFEFIVCNHHKMAFFMASRRFQKVYEDQVNPNLTKFYTFGSWKYLDKYIRRTFNKSSLKVLSIGTDVILDAYLHKKFIGGTQILLCEELRAETNNGLNYDPPFQEILTSKIWGPYFGYQEYPMLWGILSQTFATYVAAGIDEIPDVH